MFYYYAVMKEESTCPIWAGSLMVEQMPAKGMVVSLSLTLDFGNFASTTASMKIYFKVVVVLPWIVTCSVNNRDKIYVCLFF